MAIGLVVRRDYWVAKNGKRLTLEQKKNGLDVYKGQGVTKADLLAIPEAKILAWITDRDAKKKSKDLYSKWSPKLAYDMARLILGETIEDLRTENGGEPIPLEIWVSDIKNN